LPIRSEPIAELCHYSRLHLELSRKRSYYEHAGQDICQEGQAM
jgi:hypothetical protein